MVETATANRFTPDDVWEREKVIRVSNELNTRASCMSVQREDIFRLHALGMDWDIGVQIHEPSDGLINAGADGKKVGVFLLHGGAGDFKSMERLATLFVEKFRYKVVVMTFPGRLYLDDESRDWPGDTIHADGRVRTPLWQKGEYVTPDQYELVRDGSKRMKYGVRTHARAKPGSRFYDRMASWPVAFEEGMKEACRRHFAQNEYSIYVHGHSTGGPYVSMLTQRVPNITGVLAIENSTFGYINERKHQWSGQIGKIEGYEAVAAKTQESWKDPFNDLYIRTWRDLARYRGPEALGQEGPNALMRLPWLMEEILDAWDVAKKRPQFKTEYMITHNIVSALESAARAVAKRMSMSAADEQKLVDHYIGYTRELSGSGVKPVPPYLFVIAKDSRDHHPQVYHDVILPMFAQMNPAPRTHVTRFMAGVHTYTKPEQDLPMGIAPAAAHYINEAITGGFFVV
jgi:hypothetical protein